MIDTAGVSAAEAAPWPPAFPAMAAAVEGLVEAGPGAAAPFAATPWSLTIAAVGALLACAAALTGAVAAAAELEDDASAGGAAAS